MFRNTITHRIAYKMQVNSYVYKRIVTLFHFRRLTKKFVYPITDISDKEILQTQFNFLVFTRWNRVRATFPNDYRYALKRERERGVTATSSLYPHFSGLWLKNGHNITKSFELVFFFQELCLLSVISWFLSIKKSVEEPVWENKNILKKYE